MLLDLLAKIRYSMEAFQVEQWQRTHLPMQETQEMHVRSLGWEDYLELDMATHSRILA